MRRALAWAVSALILVAVALALRGRFEGVAAAGGLPGFAPSALAVVANLAGNAVLVQAWRQVLRTAGVELGWRPAAWVWAASQLARYTIGAAQVGGRAVAGRRYGVTATAGAVTTLVEVGWATSITAVLALATLPAWLPGAGRVDWLAAVAAAPALALVVGLVAPQALLRLVARAVPGAAARIDRVGLDRATAARITAFYTANAALRLAAFLVLVAAIGGTAGARAVGAYALGQLAGRLAVFAPGGIGPREGVTALVLAPVLGGSATVVLVAAARLLEMLAEAAFALVARAGRPRCG